MFAGKKNLASIFLIAVFAGSLGITESRPQKAAKSILNLEAKCGYASCPATKPNMLNVHLIAHTHDDVGWLKTVDQYYYGSETLIQKAGVQYIIDSVVQELLLDPQKRFIYVESAFFHKWWHEQKAELKEQVKMLVLQGRLEFIGGAWSMNDEAAAHYQSVIDQFAWGLKFLNDTFGECARPRIGWQIDPFGHSREMANMFAQMGYDGLFFGRSDYQDRNNRMLTQTAEMIWYGSANSDNGSPLFTGNLYNQYQPPPGFCFDILCADEPIIDAKHSPDYNVQRRVDEFYAFVKKQSHYYRTNNIIVTMGGDFTYQDANVYYKNLDKLIRYANERQANGSRINLLYSTPSCYLKSLHDAGITWPTKSDDFFPYASDPHAYWTGYFTSRPTSKRYEREGNHFLQLCKQLTTLAANKQPEFLPHLDFLRDTLGVMQHHDAITGTEKEKVASDYAKRLYVGMKACSGNTKSILNLLSTGDQPRPGSSSSSSSEQDEKLHSTQDEKPSLNEEEKPKLRLDFKSCNSLNISSCDVSESSGRFVVTLYNPLAQMVSDYIRIPVPDVNYEVLDYRAVTLETQFVPVPDDVKNLTFRDSQAKYELIFYATELPPLGYKSYYIQKKFTNQLPPVADPPNTSSLTSIGNEFIRLTFDTNGFLSAVTADGLTRILNQEFLYYEGAVGNNKEHRNRSSGAYIFRPKTDNVRVVTTAPKMTVYRGSLVEEVHQKFNEWISQVVRVYRQKQYAEFEWLVGPIPIDDDVGKEIISRFNSDIRNEGIFFTDSNGREMIKRLRDHRDTWDVELLEHTAGNYYPITTKIALEDENARMAILNDRAQGGSSMGDGSLELMVHRRLLHDDAFGVGEALNETAYGKGLVARGTHYLILGSSQLDQSPTVQSLERFTQLEVHLPPWKFFSDASSISYDEWRLQFTNIFSMLSKPLPKNVHLLTFEPWHDNEILIRLEHILEKDEDPEYSKYVQVNIKALLDGFNIKDIRETTLDGNAWLADNRRMEFVPDPVLSDFEKYTVYSKSFNKVDLLEAAKPMLGTKYSKEPLPLQGDLDAESNRLKRDHPEPLELNRLRSEKLRAIKFENISQLPLESDDSDTKYTIELSAMQIRTFILFLNPAK